MDERRMAVANALGQRGSKCATAAPWKPPMMAWSTACDDYFRATIRELAGTNADFLGSCVCFGVSVRLPQADQGAFGPRKGLNLPAASNSIAFFLSARGPPTNLKEGAS